MSPLPYRFVIDPSVPLTEAELSLQLAMIAVEGLFGQARVRLEARYQVEEARRTLAVDVSTSIGACLVRIFAALLIREFGDDSFKVSRTAPSPAPDAVSSEASTPRASASAAA